MFCPFYYSTEWIIDLSVSVSIGSWASDSFIPKLHLGTSYQGIIVGCHRNLSAENWILWPGNEDTNCGTIIDVVVLSAIQEYFLSNLVQVQRKIDASYIGCKGITGVGWVYYVADAIVWFTKTRTDSSGTLMNVTNVSALWIWLSLSVFP